ncbi:PASTA domain-containing protein [Nafulsella turpanensis]|uniref:PASTA domain-containing protein n=1 Tax=Nafulsella turpanensis TaxID=1265690 RepID=UPI00034807A4|nr:PASTA domain-containing protein [Nafulsella turpanensis]
MNYRINSFKDVLIHLAVISILALVIGYVFFDVYLPKTTNHGETITVPNLQGIAFNQLDEYLSERNLRYEVNDSTFSTEYPPLTVMKQHPKPGAQVKENRKIFLALNAKNPPKVKMPKLIDSSVKNAQLVLQSYGLELGEIRYKPDPFANAVLEQHYKGKPIEEGTQVPKGAQIDLVVGDGKGEQTFETPNLLGMDLEEAEFVAVGTGLKIGEIHYEKAPDKTPNTILRQIPPAGARSRIGEVVDLWVVEFDENNVRQNTTITTGNGESIID